MNLPPDKDSIVDKADLVKEIPEKNPDAVIKTAADGTILYANPASELMLQICGGSAGRLVPDNWKPLIADALASGEARTIENACAERVISLHIAPLPDEGCAILYGKDVTEQKRIEEAQREDEERLSLIMRGANDGIWDLNLDTGKIYFSSRWKEMLGYQEHEIADHFRAWQALIHPEDLGRVLEAWTNCVEGLADSFSVEYRIQTKSEDYSWVLCRGLSLKNNEGVPTRLTGSHTDITERKLATEALQLSEARFAGIFDIANEAIISVDEKQRIILFNQQAEQVFGYTAEEMMGRPLDILIPMESQDAHRKHVAGFRDDLKVSRKMKESRDELSGLRKNGEEFPAHISISKFALNDEYIYTAVVQDITVTKRTEKAIKNIVVGISSSIGDTFFEAITEQLAKTLGADFTIVGELTEGGRAVRTLSVCADGKIKGNFEYDLEHTPCMNVVGKHPCSYASDVAGRFPQDEMLQDMDIEGYIGIPLFDSNDRAVGLIAALFRRPIDSVEYVESIIRIFAERTAAEIERKSMEGKMRYMAHYDALTGLPNRILLLERMGEAFQSAQRAGKTPTLMLINMSRFREVNEAFGHQNGDLLLQEIATRLREALSSEDCTIARLGGDEFAVLFPSQIGEPLTTIARKILDDLWVPFVIEGLTIVLEAHIGISLYSEHCKDESELLHHADVAMQQAKQERGGYKLYDANQHTSSLHRLVLFGELRHAIEHDELTLYYQPKVELKTGRIAGVEALLRWQHPKKGLIPPMDFIPMAEQSGLIGPLTQWVFREALTQCAKWRDAGLGLKVAVNLSPRNLLDVKFPNFLASLLTTNRVAPGDITLEITEDAIMDRPEDSMKILNQLHEIGVELSIDDFGTGNSSLTYLKQLPVEEIKIDRSFITHMDTDENDAVIAYAAISLAHNLNDRKVVAEGVETREAWDLLHILGCDVAQGYFLSRPLPPDELVDWLRQSSWTLDKVTYASFPEKAAG